METITHATVAYDQKFITAHDFETLQQEAYSLAQVLSVYSNRKR